VTGVKEERDGSAASTWIVLPRAALMSAKRVRVTS
jgi:hypothetical protein